MIPSAEECFKLMDRYKMLDNIRDHSIVVEKVAKLIAQGLQRTGVAISMEKVTAGALMHDIGKSICLESNQDHAAKGIEICLKNNLDEITDIVGEHIILKDYDSDSEIHEKEIIYYADKRVNHDKVVSIEERLEYLLFRYAKNNKDLGKLIKDNFDICRAVEKKLFAKLDFGPDVLAEDTVDRELDPAPLCHEIGYLGLRIEWIGVVLM